MKLVRVSGPASEPITLSEAKRHLRVEHDVDDDLISALIVAAREWAEAYQSRALVAQTWDLLLDGWLDPEISEAWICRNQVPLPLAPVQSVESVTYLALDGASQTWDASNYRVLMGTPGAIEKVPGRSWPSIRSGGETIAIRFVAGYEGGTIPEATKAGMKLLIGHLYENREASIAANLVKIPHGVESLLSVECWGDYQ